MDPVVGSFGERLREARELRQLSQADLARLIEDQGGSATQSQVSRWERGTVPMGETLIHLPALLECDGHWLLTGEGSPDSGSPAERSQDALLDEITRMEEKIRMIRAQVERTDPVAYLLSRFRSAISPYSDRDVSDQSGINRETIRKVREGIGPEKPNPTTRSRMQGFLDWHEEQLRQITVRGQVPPKALRLIVLAEQLRENPEFMARASNHGWISAADHHAGELRARGQLDFAADMFWAGWKKGREYDPEDADHITLQDLGMDPG